MRLRVEQPICSHLNDEIIQSIMHLNVNRVEKTRKYLQKT